MNSWVISLAISYTFILNLILIITLISMLKPIKEVIKFNGVFKNLIAKAGVNLNKYDDNGDEING